MKISYLKQIPILVLILSCFKVGQAQSDLLSKYSFLSDAYPDCTNIQFSEYDLGSYSFIYGSDGRLFFEDGTFYCQDLDTNDCRNLYNLSENQITGRSQCAKENDQNEETTENDQNEETSNLIKGRIVDTQGNPLVGVLVNLIVEKQGSNDLLTFAIETDDTGSYSLSLANDLKAKKIEVGPYSTGYSCLNLLDIAISRAYILGVFNTTDMLGSLPSSIFAMDLSDSNKQRASLISGVSTLDQVMMYKILLEIESDEGIWRFYDATSNRKEDQRYIVNRTINLETTAPRNSYDFIGYQLGDLNDCAEPDRQSEASIQLEPTSSSCYDLKLSENSGKALGVQFELEYDSDLYSADVISNMSNENSFINMFQKGKINFAFLNDNLDFIELSGVSIMQVCFGPKSSTEEMNNISINNAGIVAEGYEFVTLRNSEFQLNSSNTNGALPDGLITTYPWLTSILDCASDEIVSEYQSGIFNFIYLESSGTLYFQDGTFYCQNSSQQDCRQLYNLTRLKNQWSCNDSGLTSDEQNDLLRNNYSTNNSDLTVYPNPAIDQIQITSNDKIQIISVFDLSGIQVIEDILVDKVNVELNISTLEQGYYLVRIETESNVYTKPFIKSHN